MLSVLYPAFILKVLSFLMTVASPIIGLSIQIKGLIEEVINGETCSFGGVTNLVSKIGLIFLDGLWSIESRNRRVRSLVNEVISISLQIYDIRNACLSLTCSPFIFFFVRWIHMK